MTKAKRTVKQKEKKRTHTYNKYLKKQISAANTINTPLILSGLREISNNHRVIVLLAYFNPT